MPTFNTHFPKSRHGWDIINVKSPPFGAVGDGATDDSAALQAAFDAAWGPVGSVNGIAGNVNNKAVYMPPGNYISTAYLNIIAQGGRLFGDSSKSTQISFYNPGAPNIWRPSGAGSEIRPCITLNGTAYFTMENLSIQQFDPVGTPANFGSCGIWYINWMHGAGAIPTAPVFKNMTITDFQHGICAGYGDNGQNCENGTLYNVEFVNCTGTGLLCFSQNTLNWNVVGGGCTNCAEESTATASDPGNNFAAYSAVTGSISTIQSVKMVNNKLDFRSGSSSAFSVLGGHSTSRHCLLAIGTPAFINGFAFCPEESEGAIFLDSRDMITASGCLYAPGEDTGAGIIGNALDGRLIVDGMQIGAGGTSSSFAGNANGTLWGRAIRPQTGQDLFAAFNGKVVEFPTEGPTPYAFMPAHAKFRGLTRVISDSPVTSGLVTAGSGGNQVFAYCEGATGWRIIGAA